MSKFIKIIANEHEFTFYCESRSTRTGFAHDCTMAIDYSRNYKATCHYINRTWERWNYQSACIEALNKASLDYTDRKLQEYKYTNNVTRMTSKRKAEFMEACKADTWLETLAQVKHELNTKLF